MSTLVGAAGGGGHKSQNTNSTGDSSNGGGGARVHSRKLLGLASSQITTSWQHFNYSDFHQSSECQ